MTDNIVKFPAKVEHIEQEDNEKLHDIAIDFANVAVEELHHMMHDETGDCIFTDEEYHPLNFMFAEVVSAMYLMSQGVDHPMQEIAETLFGDVDITDESDYNETNENDNEE